MDATALIVAAGSSVRFGGSTPKQFCEVAGRPLLSWTISRFEAAKSVSDIILVLAEDKVASAHRKLIEPFGFSKVVDIVAGGASRQQSVLYGLECLPESAGLVAIHDGARPMVDPEDIDAVIAEAAQCGAALLARPVTDTIKRTRNGRVIDTLDRSDLYHAQTPQVFECEAIRECHRRAAANGLTVTDDVALVEASGVRVRVVESSGPNLKVTTPEDLTIVDLLLRGRGDG